VTRVGVVEAAVAAVHRGARPDLEAAVGVVCAAGDPAPDDARRALLAFGAVLGLPWEVRPGPPAPPPAAPAVGFADPTVDVPQPAARRPTLVDAPPDPTLVGAPAPAWPPGPGAPGVPPSGAPAAPSARGQWIAVAVVLAVAVVVAVVLVLYAL